MFALHAYAHISVYIIDQVECFVDVIGYGGSGDDSGGGGVAAALLCVCIMCVSKWEQHSTNGVGNTVKFK